VNWAKTAGKVHPEPGNGIPTRGYRWPMNSPMYAQAFSSGTADTVLSLDLSAYQLREDRNWPQGRRGPATRARHDPSTLHKSIANAGSPTQRRHALQREADTPTSAAPAHPATDLRPNRCPDPHGDCVEGGYAEWVPRLPGPPPERRRLRKSLRCVDPDHAALTGRCTAEHASK
jgi:hypothetical protein